MCIRDRITQHQVRVFHDRAGLVNDLHGSKPPFSGHAVPDVHIVGGGLHGLMWLLMKSKGLNPYSG